MCPAVGDVMGWEGFQHEGGTGEAASDIAGSGGHIYRSVPLLSQRDGDGCGQTAFKFRSRNSWFEQSWDRNRPSGQGQKRRESEKGFFFSPNSFS